MDPQRALMIGDRSHDIIGAKNNGMAAIGVLYGYGSSDELIKAGASHVCATPRAVHRPYRRAHRLTDGTRVSNFRRRVNLS